MMQADIGFEMAQQLLLDGFYGGREFTVGDLWLRCWRVEDGLHQLLGGPHRESLVDDVRGCFLLFFGLFQAEQYFGVTRSEFALR